MATFTAPIKPMTASPLMIEDFMAMQPDPQFQAQEEYGCTTYSEKKASLKHIKAEAGLQFVNLPEKMKQLMDHCWKTAQASGGPRNQFQIGAAPARANHIPVTVSALQASRVPANIFEARRVQERNAAYAKQVIPLTSILPSNVKLGEHLTAVVPSDWGLTNQLERVNAYTFRGDKRAPQAIQAADGFKPPITRTDQYYVEQMIYPKFASYMRRRYGMEVTMAQFHAAYREKVTTRDERLAMNGFFAWKSMLENEAYHVGKMLANETLKGFVSTTKAVTIAKGFGDNGWVYVTLVQGGFVVPDKGKHVWTAIYGEQEIALPAPIPWSNVFGFRQVNAAKRFTGPIYLRRSLQARNAKAYGKCYELLSGKPQGNIVAN
jgi:hypothetical protein